MTNELKYRIKRNIYLEIKPGYYLEDPTTKKKTGFFFEEEIKKLEKGEKIIRRIESLDGEHGCTLAYYNPKQTFFKRLLKSETSGELVDYGTDGLGEYPFDVGEIVEIKLRKHKTEIELIIKVINHEEKTIQNSGE